MDWFFKEAAEVLNLKLFTAGKTPITLGATLYVAIVCWLLVIASERMRQFLIVKLEARTKLDRGLVEAVAALGRYFVLVLGIATVLQSAGIDLSVLSFAAGAVGIAIGLGLQNLMNNVVSGLVILADRPIKVGDRIEVGGANGEVTHINLRATTVVTNNGIAIIVPNSQFLSTQVVNWTYAGRRCRFQFPVSVDASADPSTMKRLLEEVALAHQGVLREPPPEVELEEIGDQKLKFVLSVWTEEYLGFSDRLRSELNYALAKTFSGRGLTLEAKRREEQQPGKPVSETSRAEETFSADPRSDFQEKS